MLTRPQNKFLIRSTVSTQALLLLNCVEVYSRLKTLDVHYERQGSNNVISTPMVVFLVHQYQHCQHLP